MSARLAAQARPREICSSRMPISLACADFTFPLLPHPKALRLIRLLDLKAADIGLFEGRSHLWPSKELKKPERSGKALSDLLSSEGLKCADVFLQTDPDFRRLPINHPGASERAGIRETYKRTVDYAKAAGSKHVTILPGIRVPGEPPSASWQRVREELAWRLDLARASSLHCSVEGHIGSIVPTPPKLMKLVQDVPGLSLTLDFTHFVRQRLDPKQAEPLIPYARHFHVRGAEPGRLQVSHSRNSIDYPSIVAALKEANYSGYLTLEYTWFDWERCNETDNVAETILFRDQLRKLLGRSP